ncbi:SDR family NAD(P)-dependent oxidoreductase [Mangrovicella endophytica]|uniref:SDR family NAD(P)-dependent oxidoreductase n=1 Tax=Mangrovicella endophytica TaxID=2066697 RepID=UPI000C9DF8E6|nr:SDR family oxidoreductase [Mangrovicella endophytica]
MSGARPLAGRRALVTGASRNIGRAIAIAFAHAGADVAVGARTSNADLAETVSLAAAEGVHAVAVAGDLSTSAGAGEVVQSAAAALGGLDILVNNAALRADAPIEEIDDESWARIRSSILDASFFSIRAALPFLRQSASGAIINIGGVAAHAGVAERAHVAAAKAGVAGLTRAVAAELAADGITVNCVSPGRIETARQGHVPKHFIERPTPLGRGGEPAEVAALVAFLAGPDARYLTGQTVHLNGGWYMG